MSPIHHVGTKQLTRYVLDTGNDNNDGVTWESPKRTVASALAALPQVSGFPRGRVVLGAGQFRETATPIRISAGVEIIGAGTDPGGTSRTEIKLENGRNTALFDFDTYTDAAHSILFRDLIIDGNKANNASATDPLIRIRRGGYNAVMERVIVRNANADGLFIYGQAVNFALRSCFFQNCGGAGVHHTNATGGGIFIVNDMQIDGCDEGLLFDYAGTGGTAPLSMVVLSAIKSESFVASGQMRHVIRHTPRSLAGGNPTIFVIDGIASNNASGGVSANPAIYEENGTGIGGIWTIQGATATDYARVFGSDKTGYQSASDRLTWGTFEPRSDSYAYRPTRETQGVQEHIGCYGSPEGVLSAPVGSFATRSEGSPGNTLYVKHTGTGNTGWGAVPSKLVGSKTQDWASIANGGRASTTVTVTGAALGDTAVASMSVDLQGMAITAHVSAADTVTVVLRNDTGAAIDLASGTLKAVVMKA